MGYYRAFIPNYAKIPLPLSKLLRRDQNFIWTEEQTNAFDRQFCQTMPTVIASVATKVLARLKNSGLRLRLSKCSFLPNQIEYLGHTITEGQIAPQTRKIEVIDALKAPSDVKGLRQVLGMAGYYRSFIPNSAAVTQPLTKLIRKTATYEWKEEQQSFTTACGAPTRD
ncbi:hypothetical protein GNI_220830 [Gregarina niphandrodes]|uniref:Reverse transcriptase/retrotransposon-derived protein RNase H-like domain-containing protein n=1 Tax=Gregarina niphandrodes TaxID=110365 RepID=A0A023AVL4_GRENI|nr:hypothetical protein GNI_220830 [Gregarina niphandrodes]EZG42819.1 hypothetical protein GNI_220830 [Gregarina niphandrodes]|eukprot:XP_011133902.1 hypothetical protein GNI_220830 [Gregarina niphandrodes]